MPPNEALRLASLRGLHVLDTPAEERFDRVTRLARSLFDVSIAVVSLVDSERQWFKSIQGLDAAETPRDVSFCGHAILSDEIFEVQDATQDERFHDNPLVTGPPDIRFYAGCPLKSPRGELVGTLCLIDQQPRRLDGDERELLVEFARLVEQEFAASAPTTVDDLSGLSNRRGFELTAAPGLAMCRRLRLPATLVFFDLVGFSEINDRFGRADGERLLIDFSGVLKAIYRESDIVARLGCDEFVMLMTNCDIQGSQATLERLRIGTDTRNAACSKSCELRYSFGVVEFEPRIHSSIHSLLYEADRLLSLHRRAGPDAEAIRRA
ncbi:MAG TPA: sensor domain-containing diguanylate cyclase [Burkholderiaceae bacterium]|nr:sensor domain-containing diguanylate cyclase [Burkholderiaceae bacterium]